MAVQIDIDSKGRRVTTDRSDTTTLKYTFDADYNIIKISLETRSASDQLVSIFMQNLKGPSDEHSEEESFDDQSFEEHTYPKLAVEIKVCPLISNEICKNMINMLQLRKEPLRKLVCIGFSSEIDAILSLPIAKIRYQSGIYDADIWKILDQLHPEIRSLSLMASRYNVSIKTGTKILQAIQDGKYRQLKRFFLWDQTDISPEHYKLERQINHILKH